MKIENIDIIEAILKNLYDDTFNSHRKSATDLRKQIQIYNTIQPNKLNTFFESENLCECETYNKGLSPEYYFKLTQHGINVIDKFHSYSKYRKKKRYNKILNTTYIIVVLIASIIAAIYSMKSYYAEQLKDNCNKKKDTSYNFPVYHKVIVDPNKSKDSLKKGK